MFSADTQGRAYQAAVDSSDYTPSHRVTQKDTTVGGGHVRWGWWWWWKGIGKGGRCGDKSNQTALYINKHIKLSRN